jgi:hypothetical protein
MEMNCKTAIGGEFNLRSYAGNGECSETPILHARDARDHAFNAEINS